MTGEVVKKFRKPWNANQDGCLDLIMSEFGAIEEQEEIVEDMDADEFVEATKEEVVNDSQ